MAMTPQQIPVMGGFVISEANGSRSRGWGTIAAGNGVLAPGTPLKGPPTAYVPCRVPTDEALITAILLYAVDTTTLAQESSVIVRDAEVNESMLIYQTMVAATVRTQLLTMGIAVRPAVLDGPGGTYAGGPRTTDPALANTPYGPLGNTSITPP
jgi:hypothetical protein